MPRLEYVMLRQNAIRFSALVVGQKNTGLMRTAGTEKSRDCLLPSIGKVEKMSRVLSYDTWY